MAVDIVQRLNGKVKLDYIGTPPEPLTSLLTGNHPKHEELKRKICYNNVFKHRKVVKRDFMLPFKVQGQVYHLTGNLLLN